MVQMKEGIDKLIKKNKFKKKYVIVFGSNEPAEIMIDYLAERGIKVNALIDNNKIKVGTKLKGILIYTPENLLEKFKPNAIILIASKYYYEMLSQLNKMGYIENKHIFKVVEMAEAKSNSISLREFFKHIKTVKLGENVYNSIIYKYKYIERIFLFPAKFLGDVYIAGLFLKEYMKKQNINKYLVIVDGRACLKSVKICGLKNVLSIDTNEMMALMRYSIFTQNKNIEIIHHRNPHTNSLGNIGNYKNINFCDLFKYGIYNLDEEVKPCLQVNENKRKVFSKDVIKLFKKNNLIIGKTAILCPYAKTAARLEKDFWLEIVNKLKEKGYTICTNSSGEEEPAIEGTIGLFFPLDNAIEIVEAAGMVIGLRSGFFDVISSANADIYILYPDRVYGEKTFFDFFSIKNMGLSDKIKEYVIE